MLILRGDISRSSRIVKSQWQGRGRFLAIFLKRNPVKMLKDIEQTQTQIFSN